MGFSMKSDQDLSLFENMMGVGIYSFFLGLPLALLGAIVMVVTKLCGATGMFLWIPVAIGGLLMTPTFLGACVALLGCLGER